MTELEPSENISLLTSWYIFVVGVRDSNYDSKILN